VTDATEGEKDNIWDRLRRRKVVQWGIAYAAGAWGLLQGLAYITDTFHWPERIQQLATIALLIGLPIAVTLAWFHGERGHRRVTRTELAILTLLFLLGGGLFWRYQHVSETARVATPPAPIAPTTVIANDKSIAVLPFVNMSSDQEQEYFSDGLTEELLNLLAQVPQLRVIARTSSFSFKGKDVDISELANKLNVTHVLEGSVRKAGDTVRITAQLIRASDSSHLWSQTYDRPMTDVFKVQDEIAAAVVGQLKIKLLGNAPTSKSTDPKAYALFLQGREVMRQYNSEAFEQAIALFKQALVIDPAYTPAWDALAGAYYDQIDLGVITTDQGLPLVRHAIDRVLANDVGYAPVYARLAMIEGNIERDQAAAARHVEQGLALDPVNLDVVSSAGWIARRLGRMDQSIALYEYLVRRDPINPQGHDRLAVAYQFAGRLDEAFEAFRAVIQLSPESAAIHEQAGEVLLLNGNAKAALEEIQQEPDEKWRLVGLAMAYHALGQKSESDAALAELIRQHDRTMVYQIAYVLAFRGENDRAFEWLDKAIEYRDLGVGAIPFDPTLAGLHSDPRWLPLLRRLGVAPEQLAAIKFDVEIPN